MIEIHLSEPGTLEPKTDGTYDARCTCGFRHGSLMDAEMVVDMLMAHASDAATLGRSVVGDSAQLDIEDWLRGG